MVPWEGREPFQTRQGNRLSCRYQEGRRGSEDVVPGPSVFPSRETGMSGKFWGSHEGCQVPFRTSGRNLGLPLRRCSGQGPHIAKTLEPRCFPQVAPGCSSYDGDFRLPLGLALGSPIFHSRCRGKAGGCARVTAGPKRPHLAGCPGPNTPLKGRQGPQGYIADSPGESGLASRASQGLRSPLNSRRRSLGAH